MKPVVWLVLLAALCGCNHERSTGLPDATLTPLVANPDSHEPLGDHVEVVFELLDETPASTAIPQTWVPPYRVTSQLVVLAHLRQEFFAQGLWRGRRVTVQGTLWPDEKTGAVSASLSCSITTLSGPSKDETEFATMLMLKPQTPTQIGGIISTTNDVREVSTLIVWVRPHVTAVPAPTDPYPLNPGPGHSVCMACPTCAK